MELLACGSKQPAPLVTRLLGVRHAGRSSVFALVVDEKSYLVSGRGEVLAKPVVWNGTLFAQGIYYTSSLCMSGQCFSS